MLKKFFAELIGTCVLVTFACGVAVWTGAYVMSTALAFGLVIVAMAYSIGQISGCHVNPAVSLAMLLLKKITLKEFLYYVLGQLAGAAAGCVILMLLFKGEGFGANAIQPQITYLYGDWGLLIGFVAEVVLTFVFVFVIIAVTSKEENSKISGLIIGLTLTLVHLLGIGITGTSVNPARSFFPAIFDAMFGRTDSIAQIWIWLLAPCAGAVAAVYAYKLLFNGPKAEQATLADTPKEEAQVEEETRVSEEQVEENII